MASVYPSEELRAFLSRFYDVCNRHDCDSMRGMFSPGAHVVIVGTDPEEWWTGPEGVEVLVHQTREMGTMRFEPQDTAAYCSGSAGWIVDHPRVVLEEGAEFRLRLTLVLVMEGGHWSIVHWHGSIGEHDEISFGKSLTKSIEGLEQSVRENRPDLGPASAPDGTVTIVFTDIESSAVLLDRLGDTEFLRMLAWHDRIVREVATQHRGFVVKSQGDGFMLAFPSAAFALRACLILRDRIREGFADLPVRVRAGLHSGEAIRRGEDFYGRTVVIAARVSALAMGGEILASDLVYALARGLGTFRFGEARSVSLKGLEGSYAVHPVLD